MAISRWMRPLEVAIMCAFCFVRGGSLLRLKQSMDPTIDIVDAGSNSTTVTAERNDAEYVENVAASLREHTLADITGFPKSTTVEYAHFVDKVVAGLRKHNLGASSLDYFLENIATKEMAQKCEWVEFGSWSGKTITKIATRRLALSGKRPVHGFDSFKGLPEKWRDPTVGGKKWADKYTSRGAFDRDGKPPFVNATLVTWHTGWFNATVPNFAKDLAANERLCFVHMDADIYSSTDTIFKSIEHKLMPGAYIVFDELINYPEFAKHEMKALYEMLKRTGMKLKLLGYAGPRIEKDPQLLRDLIVKQDGENHDLPQNALVQLMPRS